MNVSVRRIRAHELTFWHVLGIVVRNLLGITLFIEVGTTVLVCICGKFVLAMLIKFHAVYWLGLVLSYTLHEYLHCACFRRGQISEIEIYANALSFSLRVYEPMGKWDKLATALSGPLVCGAFGGIILIINFWCVQSCTLQAIAFIYCIHLINLLPLFADGKTVLSCFMT